MSIKKIVGPVDKQERAMIRAALRERERPPAYLAPEPADLDRYTEAYAISQAERHAARRRLLREAISRRVPAQKAGDSMAGLQTPKRAC